MNIFQQAWNSFDRSSEIKTTPFVPKTPEPKRQNIPDQAFYDKLVFMEQTMNQSPSLTLINQIITMYSECVEYFDSKQDSVKYYFVDKIQYALAETKNFNIVRNESQSQSSNQSDHVDILMSREKQLKTKSLPNSNLKPKLASSPNSNAKQVVMVPPPIEETKSFTTTESSSSSSSDQDDELKDSPNKLPVVLLNSSTITHKQSMSRRLTIQVQVQIEEVKSVQELNNLVNDYEEQTKDADKLVREDIQNQDIAIKNRLASRNNLKFNQFMGQSKSTSILTNSVSDFNYQDPNKTIEVEEVRNRNTTLAIKRVEKTEEQANTRQRNRTSFMNPNLIQVDQNDIN